MGKKNFMNYCGLLGVVALLSYTAAGYSMFPLSDSGYAGTFQDQMHILSTVFVVLLSIVSLILLINCGDKRQGISYIWNFCRNCTWYDACWSTGNEHCTKGLLWNC